MKTTANRTSGGLAGGDPLGGQLPRTAEEAVLEVLEVGCLL